ncbi:MAG TPA: hypothetical protein PK325_06145 [Cyclobacteriaceae bacterium]|nr:hypothetical protein [Cyclobacteriaceae bacterium]HMV10378.1 hypothetical protein [Cyclobacteriaceae bacterium]HMV90941.1 hypothetical protein [Cyclobacteriaceae bacterium]HMX00403.1 hypothetical protein [Cyclobacteriaceae bacterium]HMX50513.1 hypothetical protein [Cyclobacteriaceae bacterium]
MELNAPSEARYCRRAKRWRSCYVKVDIIDKKYFLESWKNSVMAMVLVIIVTLMDNGMVLKWVLFGLLGVVLSTRREIKLNDNFKSIDKDISVLGLRFNLDRTPIDKIWGFSIRQDNKNRYSLFMQKTSGDKVVLLTEDLKNDIDKHLVALKEFSGI